MSERFFADGSIDFGGGVIGPSFADIERVNAISDRLEVQDGQVKKRGAPFLLRFLPDRLKRAAVPVVLGSSAGVFGFGAVCGDGGTTEKTSNLQANLGYGDALPFAPGEDWYFVGGPHFDGSSGGVRSAIDISPTEKAMPCPGSDPYTEKFVRAVADGIVTTSGKGKSTNDKSHSIVEEDVGDGVVVGSMHLDDIQVSEGQKVKQGDPLGYASCEKPPGGDTSGVHVHEYIEKDRKPVEIDRLVLSGWNIEATTGNYQGTMSKSGESLRTADTRRCGPDEQAIRNCGGVRNDISWSEPIAQKVPTIASVPTIPAVGTIVKPEIPTVTLAPEKGKEKAPFVVKGWQFEFTSTPEEGPAYVYGDPTPRKGWKRVIIRGNMRNISGTALGPGAPFDLFFGVQLYQFKIEDGANLYPVRTGSEVSLPGKPEDIVGAFEGPAVANGYTVPFIMAGDVPEDLDDYTLSLYTNKGVKIGDSYKKSEIGSIGEPSSEILPGIEKHKNDEVWEMPGFASVSFVGIEDLPAITPANGNFVEQFAAFNIYNLTGQDMKVDYGSNIQLRVYRKDDEIYNGSPYFYSELVQEVSVVSPRSGEKILVRFANNANGQKLVDEHGLVVVLTVNNTITGKKESFDWVTP